MTHAHLLSVTKTIHEKQLLAAAKQARRKVDPDVRAARAQLLQEQDDRAKADDEARVVTRTHPEEAFKAVLETLDDVALDDLRRWIGGMSGSRMATLADTVRTDRVRAARTASLAASTANAATSAPKAPTGRSEPSVRSSRT